MSERKERCETCRFWEQDIANGEPETGECHRNAPSIVMAQLPDSAQYAALYYGVFPETLDTEWCGEWQAIPAESEQPN